MKNTNTQTVPVNAVLMTTNQLAERYSVSTRTIHAWAKSGKLTPIKIGSRGVRFQLVESDRAVIGAKI